MNTLSKKFTGFPCLAIQQENLLFRDDEKLHQDIYLPSVLSIFEIEQFSSLVKNIWFDTTYPSPLSDYHLLRVLYASVQKLYQRPKLQSLRGFLPAVLPDLSLLKIFMQKESLPDAETLEVLLKKDPNFIGDYFGKPKDQLLEEGSWSDLTKSLYFLRSVHSAQQNYESKKNFQTEALAFFRKLYKQLKTEKIPKTLGLTIPCLSERVLSSYLDNLKQLTELNWTAVSLHTNPKSSVKNSEEPIWYSLGSDSKTTQVFTGQDQKFYGFLAGPKSEDWAKLLKDLVVNQKTDSQDARILLPA